MELFKIFGSVFVKDEASAELSNIEGKADGTAGKMQSMGDKFGAVGEKATKMGGNLSKNLTLPILAVGTAAFGMAKKVAGAGDEIHKGSQRMGVSTDAYQELGYWAGQNGIEHNQLEKGVGRLNARMGEARAGNEKYSNAMEQLGVDMKGLEDGTLSTEKAFEQSIKGLSEMTNENDKAALAAELFGTKLARDLLPALNDGSLSIEDAKIKAEELGLVMDEDAVNASAAFEDAMDDLSQAFKGAFQEIATKFLPVITDQLLPFIMTTVIPGLQKFAQGIGKVIEFFANLPGPIQKIILVIVGIVAAIGPVLMIVGKIATGISALLALFGGAGAVSAAFSAALAVVTGAFSTMIAPILAVIAVLVLVYANWDKIKAFIIGFIELIGPALAAFWEQLKELFSTSMEFIKNIVMMGFNAIWEIISTIWNTIKEFFIGYWSWLIGLFQSSLSTALGIVTNIFNNMKAAIVNVWNSIKTFIGTILGTIVSTITGFGGRFVAAGKSIFTSLWNGLKSVWKGIKSWIGNRVKEMAESLQFWKKSKNEMSGGGSQGFAKGTSNAPAGWHWVGEEGPELMKFKGGEKVKTNKNSIDFANRGQPQVAAAGVQQMDHTGTITIKGVNDKNEFMESVDVVIKDILRKERRT